jgi:tetratricopeptide (TPR) repeat protein
MKKYLLAIGLLLATGAARLPWEKQLSGQLASAGLLLPPPGDTLREQMGQSATLAALGGLRSLVSIYVTLHAHEAWQMNDWETVERDYRMVTTLEPGDIDNWIRGAWHLWANAAASIEMNESIPVALREKMEQEYIDKGIEFLRQGIRNNPETAKPWVELGFVLRSKKEDYCGAAKAYEEALKRQGAPEFAIRFVGYNLAQCPGHEREAYDYLRKLYDEGPKHRLPAVIVFLKELEEKLGIPQRQRITDPLPEHLRRERAARPPGGNETK